jgi:hypothetical protein
VEDARRMIVHVRNRDIKAVSSGTVQMWAVILGKGGGHRVCRRGKCKCGFVVCICVED